MEYTVVRSSRKTLCIQLGRDGSVIVRAPRRCPGWYIQEFVNSKAGWVRTHQAVARARAEARQGYCLREGETVSICGEPFQVHLVPGLKARLHGGQMILSDGDMDRQRQAILRLAGEYGYPRLQTRLDHWAGVMGIDYQTLKRSSARTRWGSCSSDGVIRISVWLLFAPEADIDYVLVHELAHRRHFDHSPAFWALVAQVLPDYGARKRSLRAFQNTAFLQSLAEKGTGQR